MNINHENLIALVKSTKGIIMNRDMAESVTVKGAADYVTKVDFAVQEYLRTELKKLAPDVALLSEEQENRDLNPAQSYWILDPIDGTTNLIHDYHMSAVSLALYEGGRITQGIVYNPFTEEVFHAVRGEGAYLNGTPIHVSHREDFSTCIIAFGAAPYDKERAAHLFPLFQKIYLQAADFRRSASAALDLCYVAAGRIDGYLEEFLKPWDYAAGSLIIEEAGGKITAMDGTPLTFLKNADVLTATPEIYEKLKAFL